MVTVGATRYIASVLNQSIFFSNSTKQLNQMYHRDPIILMIFKKNFIERILFF